jgi:hypothetical protein
VDDPRECDENGAPIAPVEAALLDAGGLCSAPKVGNSSARVGSIVRGAGLLELEACSLVISLDTLETAESEASGAGGLR